jgi:Ricin-type beta-trefoil lectin domain-like
VAVVPQPTPVASPIGVVPWEETFTGLFNGAKSNTGSTAWTLSRATGNFDVQNGVLLVNGGGPVGVFTTQPINIAANGGVTVSVQVQSQGMLEATQDYVKLFVKVNNGAEQLVGEVKGNQTTVATLSGNYVGTTIVVVIRAYVSAGDEFYIIDNIRVVPATTSTVPVPQAPGATKAPTKAPTPGATTAPVRPPTKAPTKMPTRAPILPPAPVPVSTTGCAAFSEVSAYHIIASHSGMAVAVDGDAPGANVKQSPATSALNDNWSFVSTSNGFYHVMAQHSGYALSALGSQNGANVVQQLQSQSGIDDWCFVPRNNNNYEIRNRLSGKSLDVADFSQVAGGKVHMWPYGGGANQQFSVVVAGIAVPTPPVLTPAWLFPVETPVVAAAAANLPDGRILMWSSKSRTFYGMDISVSTWTAIYNPTTGE